MKNKILVLIFLLMGFTAFRLLTVDKSVGNSVEESVQQAKLTAYPAKELEFSAWLPWWREVDALDSITNSKGLVTILPVWYRIDKSGQLIETASLHKSEIIQLAGSRDINVMATVSNAEGYNFDPERVSLILNDNVRQNELIEKMINESVVVGLNGWDIDWEKIKFEDRDVFTAFIEKLSDVFKKNDLMLSVSVHAQTGSGKDWEGTLGQDIREIAKYADNIRVMAYDFHYSASAPGPVTPIDKLEEVVSYMAKIVPLEKLIIGLPTYGYVWTADGGSALQYDEAVKLGLKNSIEFIRDETSHSMTATFEVNGEEQTIWFEDAVSLSEKTKVVQKYGVFQISLWHIGGEDVRIWEIINID